MTTVHLSEDIFIFSTVSTATCYQNELHNCHGLAADGHATTDSISTPFEFRREERRQRGATIYPKQFQSSPLSIKVKVEIEITLPHSV